MKYIQPVWWFPQWKGLGIVQWKNDFRKFFRCSIMLGFLELRIWRKGMLPNERGFPEGIDK